MNARTPEYVVWANMLQRCANPKRKDWKNYGGRGIKVCDRWQKFENFIADMGKRPSPGFSIDRENNERGYEPDNCRWATPVEQIRNRRPRSDLAQSGRPCPAQIRAARALLDWSQPELAKRADVHVNTVKGFESGKSQPVWGTLAKIERTLKRAGVVFIDEDDRQGPGVRLREPMR